MTPKQTKKRKSEIFVGKMGKLSFFFQKIKIKFGLFNFLNKKILFLFILFLRLIDGNSPGEWDRSRITKFFFQTYSRINIDMF